MTAILKIPDAVFALYWVLVVGSLGFWVFRDARARGSDHPSRWVLVSVFTPVGLPYYLYCRYRNTGLGDRTQTSRVDRLLSVWIITGLGALVLGPLLSPPDPVVLLRRSLIVFAVLLPSSYFFLYRNPYRTLQRREST